jgi:hypothetical protein
MNVLSEMEFPHWLMVAGVVLLVLGFVGYAFHQNGRVRARAGQGRNCLEAGPPRRKSS